jgi:diguanylate cyclase (GGDEF)-like protein
VVLALTAFKIVDRRSDLPEVSAEWARTVRRFAGLWHADLADASQIARLRRNVFFAAWVLAVSATIGTALTDADASQQLRLIQYGSLLVEAVMGLAIVLWGARMGDFAFSLLLYAGLVMAALGVTAHSHPGDVARMGMLFVPNLIMGAIFLAGRRWVACHLGLVTLILVVLSGLNPEAGNIVFDLSTTATGLVTVAVSVRILRDLALRAIVDARRGEVTDPLTGLLNRRGMERLVDDYWRDHARVDTPLLALMVDVDHFKAINDTQGHAGGEEVLRRLGGLLAASVRGRDLAVRMGGEEFLILCEAPPGQGQRIAERLRRTVEEELSPVTVSIGVHEVSPQATDVLPDAVWSAVQVADRSLYEAKRRGRNCVAHALEGVGN